MRMVGGWVGKRCKRPGFGHARGEDVEYVDRRIEAHLRGGEGERRGEVLGDK